jgi:signal transduction histidine kinase
MPSTWRGPDGFLRSDAGQVIPLTAIRPRTTRRFRPGRVVLLAGARGAAHMWRVRALKAQQRQLDMLVGERTSALQAALETRDVFLQTLAHDLKTPIAYVAWHVQLLRRRAHDGDLDSSALEEGLKAIAIGASQAVAAIDELHDLTRVAAGWSLPLHRTAVDLVALARRAVSARGVVATLHAFRKQ